MLITDSWDRRSVQSIIDMIRTINASNNGKGHHHHHHHTHHAHHQHQHHHHHSWPNGSLCYLRSPHFRHQWIIWSLDHLVLDHVIQWCYHSIRMMMNRMRWCWWLWWWSVYNWRNGNITMFLLYDDFSELKLIHVTLYNWSCGELSSCSYVWLTPFTVYQIMHSQSIRNQNMNPLDLIKMITDNTHLPYLWRMN